LFEDRFWCHGLDLSGEIDGTVTWVSGF